MQGAFNILGQASRLAPQVWTSSAELRCGGQPCGLAEGSRWSCRAKGERPPEKRRMVQHPGQGCQTQSRDDGKAPQFSQQVPGSSAAPILSMRGSSESGTPAGVQSLSCAVARRSPPQKTLGDLRLPSGKPFGLTVHDVQTPEGSRGRSPSRADNFGARYLAGVAGHACRSNNKQKKAKYV